MTRPRIALIAALGTKTRVIGKNKALPWHIPDDLKRFKALTLGHPVIMGRRTYESIGKPLPGRLNIVVSATPLHAPSDVVVAPSVADALARAGQEKTDEVFVIGGGQVYAQTIDLADRLYLTLVHDDAAGDVLFPAYDHLPFTEMAREERTDGNLHYTFITYDRM